MTTKYPAEKVRWRKVKSSNVAAVGWDGGLRCYVRFLSGDLYMYLGVAHQKAAACSRAKSVGSYLARKIEPHHPAVKIAEGLLTGVAENL